MNKQIEWYFFNLSSPTNIDWKNILQLENPLILF